MAEGSMPPAGFSDMSKSEKKKRIRRWVPKNPTRGGYWKAAPLDVYDGMSQEELEFELDVHRAEAAAEAKLCSELKAVKDLAEKEANQLKSRLEVCERSRNVLFRVDKALESLPDVLLTSTPEVKVEPDPELVKQLEAEMQKGKMLEKELEDRKNRMEEQKNRIEDLQKQFSELGLSVDEFSFERAVGDLSLEG